MNENDECSSSGEPLQGQTIHSERESVDTANAGHGRDNAASSDSAAVATNQTSEVTDRMQCTSTKSDAKSLAEFREELRVKREQRRSAIADMKNELQQLRRDLAAERQINAQLRADRGDQDVVLPSTTNDVVNRVDAHVDGSNGNASDDDVVDSTTMQPSTHNVERTLRMQIANVNHQLQLVNGDVLSLNAELEMTQKQVGTLKEVIAVSKEMVNIREAQMEQV